MINENKRRTENQARVKELIAMSIGPFPVRKKKDKHE